MSSFVDDAVVYLHEKHTAAVPPLLKRENYRESNVTSTGKIKKKTGIKSGFSAEKCGETNEGESQSELCVLASRRDI